MKHIASFAVISLVALFAMNVSAQKTSDSPVLYHVPGDPTVSIRIWIKVGAQHDPPGKEGLAQLTASLVAEGATSVNPYETILAKLYPLAASYSASCDKEMTVLSGRTHKDNLDAFVPLFLDALMRPAFTDEDFTRVRNDQLAFIEKSLRYSSDEELGKATLYDFLFAGTPYGHLNAGTVVSLKGLKAADARAFYREHYTRGNVVVGLGGGYDEALAVRLRKEISMLPRGKTVTPARSIPAAFDGFQVRMVEKTCDATAISIGFPIDVRRGDADFYALDVFRSWFGEHRNSSSHLYQVIREARGMNYGDYAYIETFPNGGALQLPRPNTARRSQIFEMWIRPVPHAQRHFALRAALRELKNILDNGMTADQFELTRAFLAKYALQYAKTTSERLGMAIDSRFYGIDGEYIDVYRKKLAALTRDQVNAALRKHIQYRNMKIAVVTQDAGVFANMLAEDVSSPVTYATPKPASVIEEDKEIAVFPLRIRKENIEILPVDDMFAK